MRKTGVYFFGVFMVLLFLTAMKGSDIQNKGQNVTNKSGEQLYMENCLSCHQANGRGVPMIAPPLGKTSYVLGDKARIIGIVLNGFNEDVEIEGEYYSNPMPAFPQLTDEEIAKVLTYVRSNFGNNAEAITNKEVGIERAKFPKVD